MTNGLRPLLSVLPAAVAACVATLGLHAQSGVVQSGGQMIPGATITAIQGDSKITTTTGRDGHYVLPQLGPGLWTIEASTFGFLPDHKPVQDPSSSHQINFDLALIEARPAHNTQGQRRDAELEGQPAELPSQASPAPSGEGNNEAFLLSGSLTQGAPQAAQNEVGGNQRFGGAFNPMGLPDATGAQSSPVPGFVGGGGARGGPGGGPRGGARFGDRGAGQSRGTQAGNRRPPNNQIRGMIFGTLSNSALNARPFSISGQDVSQPSYAQARFGLVLGGPLLIPKILHDPSTFFSLSYFTTRATSPFTATSTVPTTQERAGDFSQVAQSIYDPLTRLPFPGNTIPGPRIDSVAQGLLQYIPLPNLPGIVNNYLFQAAAPQNTDNFGLRVQRNVAKNDRLAFQFNFQDRSGEAGQPFGFLDSTNGTGWSTNLSWTHNFSANHINTARVAFNRNSNQTIPFFSYGPNVAAELGIAGTSADPINYGPPNLNFTNFGALSDSSPILTRNQSLSASDNLVWVRGAHTFTFGAQFTRNDLSTQADQNGRGTFNFTGLATSLLSPTGVPSTSTGFDFADLLLGLPQSSSIRYAGISTYFRQNVWSGFAQDEWKARPSLTLTVGLRYEYFSPFSEKYGRMANLDIAPGFTSVAVVTPGASGPYSGAFPSGLINPDYTNFSPRLGLAWKLPHAGRSTVVRAGYGIYYNGQAYNQFTSRLGQQPPFAISNSVNTSATNVLTMADAFTMTAPTDITNTYAVDRNYRTPYAQTWNVSIQRELPAGFFMELGYLGTKGTHLDVQFLPNQAPPGSDFMRNQFGNAVGFTDDASLGNSMYHALQVRLQRRFRNGISMTALYTFSKSIDDSSTFGGVGNTVAQNWLNLGAERGLSSFDRRHVLTMNWVWTSPVGTPTSHFAADPRLTSLLKDWQLSGSLTAETGTPLTARVLGNSAQLAQTNGVGSGRADATGAPVSSGSEFFNPAAFSVPLPGDFGNAGRNTIPGPAMTSVNLAFGRSFQFGESRRRLELRVEANNVLNQVSITNVNTVVNSINYGLPLSAGPMRTLTAVLRFRF